MSSGASCSLPADADAVAASAACAPKNAGAAANMEPRRNSSRRLKPVRYCAKTCFTELITDTSKIYRLLPGIERLKRAIEKLLLQPRSNLVGFYSADAIGYALRPGFHIKFAQLLCSRRSISGVMIGKFRVPPDSGVYISGKIHAVEIGPMLVARAVEVDQVRARDQRVCGFRFAGMLIHFRLQLRPPCRINRPIHDVDHVIVTRGQLGLGKEREQVIVAAMSIYDEDLLATVTGHFIGGFLKQLELEFG